MVSYNELMTTMSKIQAVHYDADTSCLRSQSVELILDTNTNTHKICAKK